VSGVAGAFWAAGKRIGGYVGDFARRIGLYEFLTYGPLIRLVAKTLLRRIIFANMIGLDNLRYFLTRQVHLGNDAPFSLDLVETCVNSELANNLGNLVNRVTSMAHRYRGGVLTGRGVDPLA